MPNFDREALRKGSAAIDAALESAKRGDFRPFLSNIFWKDDKDYHYLLFLNPLEEIPQVQLHPFINIEDGIPHMIMARTWEPIGERTDPIQDRWNYKPRLTNLAIAVELVPVTKIVNGYEKPIGFEVATVEFERKIRDDDGQETGETETCEAPRVGLVAQSPFNFFNQLRSYDATEGPVHSTPLKVTRLGKKDVTYNVVGYDRSLGIELDLSGLLNNIENVSYVSNPIELLEKIADLSEEEQCIVIGDYLLYKRMDELCDPEAYDALLSQITQPSKFGDNNDKKDKPTRSSRPSQRRKSDADEPEAKEEKVTRSSPPVERLKALKEKSSRAKA